MTWTCESCGRRFGRRRQSHECAPALSFEEYFATGLDIERPVFEAVRAHLDTVGEVYVEPVAVGLLFKRSRTFVELRPQRRVVALYVLLSRVVEHPRIARRMRASAGRTAHVVRLAGPDDVDEDVRGWLTESYLDSPP